MQRGADATSRVYGHFLVDHPARLQQRTNGVCSVARDLAGLPSSRFLLIVATGCIGTNLAPRGRRSPGLETAR
jgi:hypothetical protein